MFKLRLLVMTAALFVSGGAYAQCVATAPKPPGDHYQPIKESKVNVGKGFLVSGYVRRVGDCKPVADAKVGHWQPNAKGMYDDDLRAYVVTDRNGRYSFTTERPGSKPPEMYFMVMVDGYKTLVTKWVGADQTRDRVEVNLIIEPMGK